jgi:undecaprenyl-phosphate 4-deoxy-4-formamido-L-arabinose transferase
VACDRALLSCCVAGAVRLRTSAPACGDSAYGTGAARTAYRDVGVHTVIKSKPLRAAAPGGFALGNFAIDEPGCTVTCSSAVQTRPRSRKRPAEEPETDSHLWLCAEDCPLRRTAPPPKPRITRRRPVVDYKLRAVPTVSVVIPVYRAALTLRELYGQLSITLQQIAPTFEIIFVEDFGGDESWSIITELAAADQRVRGIRMSRNYGQHNAVLCGIRAARYDVTVTMDDDLQHPVSEIEPLLAALGPDVDVVYGAPQKEQHGFLRDAASRLTKLALASAMGAEAAHDVSAFRVFRTRLREGFSDYRSPTVFIDVLLSWTTSRFAVVKVRHAPRMAGVSGYSVGRLIRHAINLITGFSTLPLQISSFIGFAFLLLGAAILVIVIANFLINGNAVPGFAFLASIIAIFSGAQLFALGVIGEYLARMHFRTMDRPTYLVRETVACDGFHDQN